MLSRTESCISIVALCFLVGVSAHAETATSPIAPPLLGPLDPIYATVPVAPDYVYVGNASAVPGSGGQFTVYGVPALRRFLGGSTSFAYTAYFSSAPFQTDSFRPTPRVDNPSGPFGPSEPSHGPPSSMQLRVVGPNSLGDGESTQLVLTAKYRNKEERNIASPSDGTQYAFSDSEALLLDGTGKVTARPRLAAELVFIYAIHQGLFSQVSVVVQKSTNPDINGDGIPDAWAQLYGFDPLSSQMASADPDGDGLTNLQEFQLGTNPLVADTDRDGLPDGVDPDPLHAETQPPTVAITAPASGSTLISGQSVSVTVQATDNVGVAHLIYALDGVVFSVDPTSAATTTVPSGKSNVTFSVTASDFAGNSTTTSQAYSVVATLDTVIIGRVLDGSHAVVPGASVKIFGGNSTQTTADGTFSMSFQTQNGNLANLSAQAVVNGRTATAFRSITIAAGQSTVDVGDVVLQDIAMECDLGTRHLIPLNDSESVTLPFPFTFYGQSYPSVFINGHGSLSFGSANAGEASSGNDYSEYPEPNSSAINRFVSGVPTIAPLYGYVNASAEFLETAFFTYHVPNPSGEVGVYVKVHADRVVFTWFKVHHSKAQSDLLDSFQVVLYQSGEIRMYYTKPKGLTNSVRSFVGLTPGSSQVAGAVQVDFSHIASANSNGVHPLFELFPSTDSTFDLAGKGIVFDATPGGGYTASVTSLQGTPGNTTLSGRVVDHGVPVGGVRVALASGEQAITDASGNFTILVHRQPIFVKSGGGPGDGTSWQTAFSNLQDAMKVSDVNEEIWVAQGTYHPPVPTGLSADRAAFIPSSLAISTIAVYGGFVGTESQRNQRDWVNHPTILSGDNGVAGDQSDNSKDVVLFNGGGTLDGFTVRDAGNPADFGNSAGISGGHEIAHCVVINNSYGHGIFGADLIRDSFIVGNSGASTGGGIFSIRGAVRNCVIANNRASSQGGGLYMGTSTTFTPSDLAVTTVTHCSIFGNTAPVGCGAYLKPPSIVFGRRQDGSLQIRNGILFGNLTGGANPTVQVEGPADVQYSLVQGGMAGAGNLDADPLFVDGTALSGADLIFGTSDDGLTLGLGSPGIDAASITYSTPNDILGASRPVGPAPDVGAYEFGGTPVPEAPVPPATLNHCRRVAVLIDDGLGSTRTMNGIAVFVDTVNVLEDVDLAVPMPSGVGWVPDHDRNQVARGSVGAVKLVKP